MKIEDTGNDPKVTKAITRFNVVVEKDGELIEKELIYHYLAGWRVNHGEEVVAWSPLENE